jgi:hypothetical protein
MSKQLDDIESTALTWKWFAGVCLLIIVSLLGSGYHSIITTFREGDARQLDELKGIRVIVKEVTERQDRAIEKICSRLNTVETLITVNHTQRMEILRNKQFYDDKKKHDND